MVCFRETKCSFQAVQLKADVYKWHWLAIEHGSAYSTLISSLFQFFSGIQPLVSASEGTVKFSSRHKETEWFQAFRETWSLNPFSTITNETFNLPPLRPSHFNTNIYTPESCQMSALQNADHWVESPVGTLWSVLEATRGFRRVPPSRILGRGSLQLWFMFSRLILSHSCSSRDEYKTCEETNLRQNGNKNSW